MIINLNEIPDTGKDYDINENSPKVSTYLPEFLHGKQFCILVSITPVDSIYELKGRLALTLPLICSFCAGRFNSYVDENFQEILIIDKKAKLELANTEFSPDVTLVTQLNSHIYDLGAAIREVAGLAQPNQPICRQSCKGLCPDCGVNLNKQNCCCAVKKTTQSSPFSILKELKLN